MNYRRSLRTALRCFFRGFKQLFAAMHSDKTTFASNATCTELLQNVPVERVGIPPISLILLFCVGCGGGEDFSTPIQGVSERLAKTAERNGSDGNKAGMDTSQTAETPDGVQPAQKTPDTLVGSSSDVANSDSSATSVSGIGNSPLPVQSPQQPADSEAGVNSEQTEVTDSTDPVSTEAGTTRQAALGTALPKPMQVAESASPEASKTAGEKTMTASGRTAQSLADKKTENSKMTVGGNAEGLLGSLKGEAPTTEKTKPSTVSNSAPEILSRFGRMALSQPDWIRLVTQLSGRFYVGTSFDGTRVLASSGERSCSVVQIDAAPELPGRFEASKHAMDEVLQTITSLPGQIRCMELTGSGSAALIGTADGRVLVRMVSSKRDWDLYARDFLLFQDEIRASARLSDDAIVLLREIHGERLLSIDDKGQGGIWKIADVIQPVPAIDSISVTSLNALKSATVTPAPVAEFELKGLQILSFSESADGRWVAIVSSDETSTVIETSTGNIIDQLNAEHFADTQPVCAAFLPERQELITGLADGRVIRRSFGKDTAAVSGVNDAGEQVDYDMVFVPDVGDPPDSVTAIAVIPGTNFACVGSVSGMISRLDISQRRMERLPFKQSGAVLEVKVCNFGTLTIGDERRATIFDQPVSPNSNQPPTPLTLQLPTDDALQRANSGTFVTEDSRRSTNRTEALHEPLVDPEMLGVRPSEPEFALLQHQLRTSVNPAQKQSVRRSILTRHGKDVRVLVDPAEVVKSETVAPSSPVMISEYTTDYLFAGQAWQDVRMSCSLDGRIAVLSHSSRPGITVVDMPTGVVLRRWTGIPNPRQILLNEQHQRLIPSGPATAELNPATGAAIVDLTRRYLVCAVSPDKQSTVLGHFGSTGLAADALTRIDDGNSRRTNSHEMFETMVTALAYSSDGNSLFAAFRGRDQATLQELDPVTLAVRSTLLTESLSGAVPRDYSAALDGKCGTTLVLNSATSRSLLTYGTYEDGSQLRLWRRSSKGWPKESVLIFRDENQLPDSTVPAPVVFVNQMESKLAVITKSGLSILNTKKEKLESQLPIPDVGGRRPSCCFSPNAKWIFIGDADGTIWVLSLSSPAKKALTFQAHSGPIAGLSISADGKFLLTAGEDNRIRSWFLGEFPGP